MSFTTCSPDLIKYWKTQKVPTKLVAAVDGVSYVEIDIDKEDPRLKHPDFFKLAIEARRFENEAIISHMRPPIYTIKKDGKYSDIPDKDGNRAVPLSRQVGLLTYYLTNPKAKEPEFIIALLPRKEVLFAFLNEAIEAGIDKIIYLATKKHSLDLSTPETLQLIRHRK